MNAGVDGRRKTVLYVEDVIENVELMRAIMSLRPGVTLWVAEDGMQALQMATARPPDLLLLDLSLPDCHATELLHLLRKQPGLSGVPAVAVTADHDFRPTGTGFREVWKKPLQVMDVLARIDALLATPLPTPLPPTRPAEWQDAVAR